MRILTAVLLVVASFVGSAHAASPVVQITACGDVVPRNSHGILMNDLDCTGFVGGIVNSAISMERSSSLDLQGHTVTGGLFGIACSELCSGGNGTCSTDRCEITNGTVTGAEASGITGDRVTVRHVTASNNGEAGVQGYHKARAYDSILTQNGYDGIFAWTVQVERCTATGNGRAGVLGGKRELSGNLTHGISVRDSTVTGNGTSSECGTRNTCADLMSSTRPRVRRSTCVSSASPGSTGGACGVDWWCVCSGN
jgi:hypothetical protein